MMFSPWCSPCKSKFRDPYDLRKHLQTKKHLRNVQEMSEKRGNVVFHIL